MGESVNKTTKVKRLLLLLERAKSTPGDLPTLNALSSLLECKNDIQEVFKRLESVHILIDEAKKAIETIENGDHFLTQYFRLNQVFFPLNYQARWSEHKKYISEGCLTELRIASSFVDKQTTENEIDEDDLIKIHNELTELFNQAESAEISTKIKTIILDLLNLMSSAIAEYRIRGESALHDFIFKYFKQLNDQQDIINRTIKNKDEASIFFHKIHELIVKINDYTTCPINILAIGVFVKDIIIALPK
jgi:hypothetical protein